MSWSVFLAALLQFVRPLAMRWLEELLKRAEELLKDRPPASAAVAVRDVFDEARRGLWWWERSKRRRLDAVERVALARAEVLADAARTDGAVPVMTGREFDAVARVE